MARRVLGLGVCLSAVMVLSFALSGCAETGAAPESPQKPASSGKDITTFVRVLPNADWRYMLGASQSQCAPGDWQNPDNTGYREVNIDVVSMKGYHLNYPVPPCAKESRKGNGKLKFVANGIPSGYSVEIDILSREVNNKAVKGPFKHAAKTDKQPSAGRCVLKEGERNKYCEFTSHNMDVPKDFSFGYNVYLYDDKGELVDAVDPGIMVVEYP